MIFKRRATIFAISIGITIPIIMALLHPSKPLSSERIFYIQYSQDNSSNLWMVDPKNPSEPEQLTFNTSNERIYEYQTTLDGHFIAYRTWVPDVPEDSKLMLLDMDTKDEIEMLTCSEPQVNCYFFALGRVLKLQNDGLS